MSRKLIRIVQDLKKRAGLERVPDGILYIGILAVGLLVVFAAWRWWPHQLGVSMDVGAARLSSSRPAPIVVDDPAQEQSAENAIAVHVVGAVALPGLYELESGARLSDAIAKAGGPTNEAALDAVNLAAILTDGTRVEIPTRTQVQSGEYVQENSTAGTPSSSAKVNINVADVTQLQTLPGIGPSTAEKIVTDRTQNGKFGSPEDLMRVSGIGEKKFEAVRDMIVVR